jgi:hypothetical protein
MKFYKGVFSSPMRYEYYWAGAEEDPYYWYSPSTQKWRTTCYPDDVIDTWLERKQSALIEEVSPLEVIVVIGSFPKEYEEEV